MTLAGDDPPRSVSSSAGVGGGPVTDNGPPSHYDPAFVALNRDMEAKFRRGEISFASFDWHLRHICGV
jgi:hypothetical protein